MDWLQFAAQWIHVFLGIFWFGSSLAINFIVVPAMAKLPIGQQREFGRHLGERADWILLRVAMAVIALGFLRGTVFGPIKSLDMLTSTYGITWLVGLAAATGTFVWGSRFVGAAIHRMNTIPEDQVFTADGSLTPAFAAAFATVKRNGLLELIGFFAVFTCMILMRFGQ